VRAQVRAARCYGPAVDVSVLTVRGLDRPGLAAGVSTAIAASGGNIANADQHTDRESGMFLQRLEIGAGCDWAGLTTRLDNLRDDLGIDVTLHHPGPPPRLVIACSRQLHCAADLLGRIALGELEVMTAAVVSDHRDAEELAQRFDVPFHHLPVGDDRLQQEAALASLLESTAPDTVVLARYMRVLPRPIVQRWFGQMINIHHSFLPAFVGAQPHRRAHERGVKLIGATAHYVTEDLDAGPIIAQDIVRVTHRDEVADLIRKGRDVERIVLADAVRLHLEHRVVVFGNRTCVFD
jgi:formyltetrahydrofolate deformylase